MRNKMVYSKAILIEVELSKQGLMPTWELEFPFRESNTGQKYLSYLGPKTWNSLPSELKSIDNISTFKHKIKENFSQNIQKEEDHIYVLVSMSDSALLNYVLSKGTYKSIVYSFLQPPLRGPLWK